VTWVDWAIVIFLVVSVLGGLQQGFFRSVCSLGGLLLGLAIAAWNYGRAAALLSPFVHIETVADTIGFLLIALAVMAVAGIFGSILSKTFRKLGLGCLDRLAGAVFGLVQGVLLVTLCILVAVAFFPKARWLAEGQLPRQFFGVCHLSTSLSPSDLANRIRGGLKELEVASPQWMHPEAN
jgi:membrane protein required for colicin V production